MYKVSEQKILLDYLIDNINFNRKKAKALLTNKQVKVNNKIVTKYNHVLNKNDVLEISKFTSNNRTNDLNILYEDTHIIVVNKKPNLLTIGTIKEKENTLYHKVSEYVKESNYKNKIFVIHRLDKDTSGIVIFAKDLKTKNMYQDNWDTLVKYRGYIAIVEGILDKKEDLVKVNLKENKNLKVYVARDGKESITKYKVIKENKDYSLLNIELLTGRKNQIRATFEYLNHPIIGDKKYNSIKNPINRLGLHSNKLIIIDPYSNKEMVFETKVPSSFMSLF